ncbi:MULTISPECIES: FUSC family protein [Legionella]|uniref:Fusaric acid resistance protein family protein n=1 Tax=Legionella maceachernii TaxID=466 RepID=A0A0W0W3Z1_9GAMM|nr:FUSC family protein [Legionella maceachernii]KTD27172.1 Fusaric acid resistance protein family protein [Legionella maceachernii]SKA13596.1 Fusaric acid resistance protein-like [Legionella maceachernii]SUP04795.1 Predicted membrane protein [Legionella maceachernii]
MTNKIENALIIGLQMCLSGLICLTISQYFHFHEGFWSVVTVSSIARPNFSATFVKAFLRLTGTLCGALVGFILAMQIGYSPLALFFAVLLFSTITTYIGLQTRPYNYLSVVAGFSAVIVIQSFLLNNIKAVALYRTLEVCLGIIVVGVVSWIMSKLTPAKQQLVDHEAAKKIKLAFKSIHFSKADLIDSFIIGITVSLTFLSWMIFRYPQGVWVTITLFVILENTVKGTHEKGLARFLGQCFAAILGGSVAILFPNSLIIIGAVLALGFFLCGMSIGYEMKFSATGNHAGSALAIMLLAGLPGDATEVVIGRFLNVLAGIVIATFISWLVFKE